MQLLTYYNCLLLVKDLGFNIEYFSGGYGNRINIKELINVSKEYGIYENAYKTAFTKIGIAFGALIIYIIFIYRNKNKNAVIK